MSETRTHTWAAPKAYAYGLLAGGLVLLVAAALGATDAAGIILMVVAALMLLSFGGSAAVIRPRLTVVTGDTTTVTVRTLLGARTYAAPDVERVRVLGFRRLGRRIDHLELELAREPGNVRHDPDDDDDLRIVVLSRWDLGAAPTEVADVLADAGLPVERTG